MDLQSRLKQLTTKEPVMLFMKGTPGAEKCGFRFYVHTCASFVGCFTAVCGAQPSPFVK